MYAKISKSYELCQDHGGEDKRNCLHIELDITDTALRYQTGDHVAVYPQNNPEMVERLAKALGLETDEQLDSVFEMKALDRKHDLNR